MTEAGENIEGERDAEKGGWTVLKSRKRRSNNKTSTVVNCSAQESQVQTSVTVNGEDEITSVHLETAQEKAKENDETA